MKVWLNGRFVDAESASISIFDAGIQHAVGLFETMSARNGRVFRAHDHMERLADSAAQLQLTERLRVEPLVEALHLLLTTNEMTEARLRLTITGGNLSMLQSGGESPSDPTIFIVAQPPTAYPDEFFQHGVKTTIAKARANPWDDHAGHKTLNYWRRIRALQDAGARGGGEAIWLDLRANVTGGSVSNLFMVKDGRLMTPIARGETRPNEEPSPVLPGITRQTVLELAARNGIDGAREDIAADDLFEADEIFLTNSSWGVLPVVQVEKKPIGDGKVGPMTRDLRTGWLELVNA